MEKIIKKISVLSLMLVLLLTLASCGGKTPTPPVGDSFTEVDYVSELKLDMNTSSLKAEVTVKSHIDGDTTHFYVDKTVNETGVLKARYLAINTPESTGKIEEWGKAASKFTKEKLSNATSIIIESDNEQWN
jgi:micrococcal nuclease